MKNNTVLFIDDDQLEHIKLGRLFEKNFKDVELKSFIDAKEALAFLNKNKHALPQLILLDINMPELSGFDVLDILKNDFYLRKIPVVIFSTSSNPTDVNKSYDKQVSGYFVKPFKSADYVDILSVISNYWTNSQQIS